MEDMPPPSFQPSFSITNAITTALTQIERARGFLEADKLSEQWVRAMGGKGVASMAVFSATVAWHAGSRETELVEGPLNGGIGFLPAVQPGTRCGVQVGNLYLRGGGRMVRSGALACGLVYPVATGFLPVLIDAGRRTGRKPVATWGRLIGAVRGRRGRAGFPRSHRFSTCDNRRPAAYR